MYLRNLKRIEKSLQDYWDCPEMLTPGGGSAFQIELNRQAAEADRPRLGNIWVDGA